MRAVFEEETAFKERTLLGLSQNKSDSRIDARKEMDRTGEREGSKSVYKAVSASPAECIYIYTHQLNIL